MTDSQVNNERNKLSQYEIIDADKLSLEEIFDRIYGRNSHYLIYFPNFDEFTHSPFNNYTESKLYRQYIDNMIEKIR